MSFQAGRAEHTHGKWRFHAEHAENPSDICMSMINRILSSETQHGPQQLKGQEQHGHQRKQRKLAETTAGTDTDTDTGQGSAEADSEKTIENGIEEWM